MAEKPPSRKLWQLTVKDATKITGGHVGIFVDEKKFVVDEVVTWSNSRIIARKPSEVASMQL